MTPQVHQLVLALSADQRTVHGVVRQALADALSDTGRPYAVAVVAAVQRRVAAARSDSGGPAPRPPADRLRQAVAVLCDVQGHSHSSAAALLGRPASEVAALHIGARADVGVDGPRGDCRGWHVVSRMEDLTPPEKAAGERHLARCRNCREGLAARAAARLRIKAALPIGGTVVGGGVAAFLSTLGGGSVAAGTAALGAAAVLGTAGLIVVAPPAAMTTTERSPVSVSRSEAPSPVDAGPAATAPAARGPSAPPIVSGLSDQDSSSGPARGVPSDPAVPPAARPGAPAAPLIPAPIPLPGQRRVTPPPAPSLVPPSLPLPSAVPLPTLPLPLPSSPVPLPTVSPLPLPASPVPLPTVSPSPSPLPLPSSPVPLPTVSPLPLPASPVPLPTVSPSPSPLPLPSSPVPLPTVSPLPLPSSPVPPPTVTAPLDLSLLAIASADAGWAGVVGWSARRIWDYAQRF